VLFSYEDDRRARMLQAIATRPIWEPTLDALRYALADLVVDTEGEQIRHKMIRTSPAVRAEALLREASLAEDLAAAIGARLTLDPTRDPLPSLVARTWMSAAHWFKVSAVSNGIGPVSSEVALTAIDGIIRQLAPVLAGDR
jgi:hypothetical protein